MKKMKHAWWVLWWFLLLGRWDCHCTQPEYHVTLEVLSGSSMPTGANASTVVVNCSLAQDDRPCATTVRSRGTR